MSLALCLESQRELVTGMCACMCACVCERVLWWVDEVVRDGGNTCCPVFQCMAYLRICTSFLEQENQGLFYLRLNFSAAYLKGLVIVIIKRAAF